MTDAISKPKTRDIETEVEINAPVEAVWKALTDAEELTRWFPLEAGTNPDGTLRMSWRDEFCWDSRIEIAEPNRHFRITSVESLADQQPAPEAAERSVAVARPTVTDFFLEARGGKTVLRLVHSGFSADAEWDALYDGTRRGWKFQLWSLRHYLENHRDTPRETAYVRIFLNKLSRQEAWQRLFSINILAHEGRVENLRTGGRYALRTATGDYFKGVVQTFNPPQEFSAIAENFNNGILQIQLDALFNYRDVNFYLFTYGIPKQEVRAIESRMRGLLRKLEE